MKRIRPLSFVTLVFIAALYLSGCAGVDVSGIALPDDEPDDRQPPHAPQEEAIAEERPDRRRPFPEVVPVVKSDSPLLLEVLGLDFQANDISFPDRYNGWAVGANGAASRTSDGGDSWERIDSGISGHLHVVDFLDEMRGVVAGEYGQVAVTADGGASWNLHDMRQEGFHLGEEFPFRSLLTERAISMRALHSARYFDEKTIVVAGELGMVYRSDDGGNTWRSISHETVQTIYGIDMSRDGTMFLAGGAGYFDTADLFRSVDGGELWTQMLGWPGYEVTGVSVAPTGRVALFGFTMVSDDSGESFQSPTDRFTVADERFHLGNWSSGLFAAHAGWVVQSSALRRGNTPRTGISLLESRDGGDSWVAYESDIIGPVRVATVPEPGIGYMVANDESAGRSFGLYRLRWE